MKIYFCIDDETVDEELIEIFSLKDNARDIRYSKSKKTKVINFVGIIIKEKAILISMPKNYISFNNKAILTKEDIKMIFHLLLKESSLIDSNTQAQDDYSTSYPFNDFLSVYDYYNKYGLYVIHNNYYKKGSQGKISWKETMRKSEKIISNNSIIFNPLITKKSNYDTNFITDCMIYIINSTIDKFSYLIELPRISKKTNNVFNNYNNDYIISKLREISSTLFKDTERTLIHHMISFFSNYSGGDGHILKHYNFDAIWENIVEKYLNDYFKNYTWEDNQLYLNFHLEKNTESKKFNKALFNVDKINENYNIQPDHYYISNNVQYIFDSKYTKKLKGIDYKQIVYYYFLKNKVIGDTINTLFIPTYGENKFQKQFELKEEFYHEQLEKVIIYKYELNIKMAIKNYLNIQ